MAEAKKTKEEEKSLKLPKTLAQCADLLYETQQKRYVIQHTADDLKKLESALTEKLIQELPAGEATGVAGKVGRVSVVAKTVPVVSDWAAFWKNFRKDRDMDLLKHRLSTEAVQARWDAGKVVPGVETYISKTLSVKKV